LNTSKCSFQAGVAETALHLRARLRASAVANGTFSAATFNHITYWSIYRFCCNLDCCRVLADPGKATTIAFVNASSLKPAQSGQQPSNTSSAASSALIPTRNAACERVRRRLARGPQKARMSLSFHAVMAGLVNASRFTRLAFSPGEKSKTWMPATSAGMTALRLSPSAARTDTCRQKCSGCPSRTHANDRDRA
jgi:hypothetical protein